MCLENAVRMPRTPSELNEAAPGITARHACGSALAAKGATQITVRKVDSSSPRIVGTF